MGMLAPGFATLAQDFNHMEKDLHAQRDEYGMLGMRSCLDAAARTTGSEIVIVCYFRTLEGLQAFAHSPYHRKGWDWYTRNMKHLRHISIWHETYHVPKGNWESIYVTSHSSGLASTAHEYFESEHGVNMWASPVVDASKGLLRTSVGRMSGSEGKEHEKYDMNVS